MDSDLRGKRFSELKPEERQKIATKYMESGQERDHAQNSYLADYLATLQFFKSTKMKQNDIFQICKNAECFKVSAGQKLVEYGDPSHNFFIVIEGVLDVLIPTQVELNYDEQASFHQKMEKFQKLRRQTIKFTDQIQFQYPQSSKGDLSSEQQKEQGVQDQISPVGSGRARQASMLNLIRRTSKLTNINQFHKKILKDEQRHSKSRQSNRSQQLSQREERHENSITNNNSNPNEPVVGLGADKTPRTADRVSEQPQSNLSVNQQNQQEQLLSARDSIAEVSDSKSSSSSSQCTIGGAASVQQNTTSEQQNSTKEERESQAVQNAQVETIVEKITTQNLDCEPVKEGVERYNWACNYSHANRCKLLEGYFDRNPESSNKSSQEDFQQVWARHVLLYHDLPDAETLPKMEKVKEKGANDHTKRLFKMTRVHSTSPGDLIGILGFETSRNVKKPKRAARLVAATDVHVMIIDKFVYEKNFKPYTQRQKEDDLIFLKNLPMFAHKSKNQIRSLLNHTNKVRVERNSVLLSEGSNNDQIYIVVSGEFEGCKKLKLEIPQTAHNKQVKDFLYGATAKRSTRSIFNNKIKKMTNSSGLTQLNKFNQDQGVFLLGKGQCFGEERFVQMLERLAKQQVLVQNDGSSKLTAQKFMITNFKDDKGVLAPYTIRCLSKTAELIKISGVELFEYVRKDFALFNLMIRNVRSKREMMGLKSQNMHLDLKFSQIEIEADQKEQNEAFLAKIRQLENEIAEDEGRELEDFDEFEELGNAAGGASGLNEDDQLRHLREMLMQPGMEYREKLHEIVEKFPMTRRALRMPKETYYQIDDQEGCGDNQDGDNNSRQDSQIDGDKDHSDRGSQDSSRNHNKNKVNKADLLSAIQKNLKSTFGVPEYAANGAQKKIPATKNMQKFKENIQGMVKKGFEKHNEKSQLQNIEEKAQHPHGEPLPKEILNASSEKTSWGQGPVRHNHQAMSSIIVNAFDQIRRIEKQKLEKKQKRVEEEKRRASLIEYNAGCATIQRSHKMHNQESNQNEQTIYVPQNHHMLLQSGQTTRSVSANRLGQSPYRRHQTQRAQLSSGGGAVRLSQTLLNSSICGSNKKSALNVDFGTPVDHQNQRKRRQVSSANRSGFYAAGKDQVMAKSNANQLLIGGMRPSQQKQNGLASRGELATNKSSMLENVIYNPQNYAINSNYHREFDHKRKSEGQDTINHIRSLHGQSISIPSPTRQHQPQQGVKNMHAQLLSQDLSEMQMEMQSKAENHLKLNIVEHQNNQFYQHDRSSRPESGTVINQQFYQQKYLGDVRAQNVAFKHTTSDSSPLSFNKTQANLRGKRLTQTKVGSSYGARAPFSRDSQSLAANTINKNSEQNHHTQQQQIQQNHQTTSIFLNQNLDAFSTPVQDGFGRGNHRRQNQSLMNYTVRQNSRQQSSGGRPMIVSVRPILTPHTHHHQTPNKNANKKNNYDSLSQRGDTIANNYTTVTTSRAAQKKQGRGVFKQQDQQVQSDQCSFSHRRRQTQHSFLLGNHQTQQQSNQGFSRSDVMPNSELSRTKYIRTAGTISHKVGLSRDEQAALRMKYHYDNVPSIRM